MASYIMTDVQLVGAGANLDALPAAGFEWEVLEVGSSVWVGVAPNAVPQVNVGIFNGLIGPAWILQAVNTRGWNRVQRLHVNVTNYLRLNNPGGAGANVSFVAKVARAFGAAASNVITQLATVAAGANWDLIPVAGIEWLITDVGSSLWIGAAPAGLPDVTVQIFDATLAATVCRGADVRGWDKNMHLLFNTANYLRLTNTNAAQAVLGISGVVARAFGAGATVVETDVQAIGAGANVDVRPAAGEEWCVYEIGASVWLGVSPAALPALTVQIFDATLASTILTSTDWKGWLNDMQIYIDNTNYLRFTDTGGGGNFCISAALTRQYS